MQVSKNEITLSMKGEPPTVGVLEFGEERGALPTTDGTQDVEPLFFSR